MTPLLQFDHKFRVIITDRTDWHDERLLSQYDTSIFTDDFKSEKECGSERLRYGHENADKLVKNDMLLHKF